MRIHIDNEPSRTKKIREVSAEPPDTIELPECLRALTRAGDRPILVGIFQRVINRNVEEREPFRRQNSCIARLVSSTTCSRTFEHSTSSK